MEKHAVLGPWACAPLWMNRRLRNAVGTLKSHFVQMNEAVASSNLSDLRDTCQTGLFLQLRNQMQRRKKSAKVVWSLVNEAGELTDDLGALKAKVVNVQSAMAPPSPGIPNMGIQQVAVYLEGMQSLKFFSGGEENEKRQAVGDYWIMQRRIVGGEVQAWYLYGACQPTTLEQWISEEEAKKEQEQTAVPGAAAS